MSSRIESQDEEVEKEIVEKARVEDEKEKQSKKRKRTIEEIEEREALEEQSPAPGYPYDTTIQELKEA